MERIKGKDVAFVLSAALFMAIVDVLFYLLIDGNPLKSLLILGANYMMALAFWVVLYLSSLIHLRKVLQPLFGFVISLYTCLLTFCWYRFGTPVDKGMIALITGTNNAEANEFFHTYITPLTIVLFIVAVLLVFVAFLWLSNRQFPLTKKSMKWLCIFTLLCCGGLGYSFYTLPGRIEGIVRTEQKNLADYLQHPEMIATSESHPDVVMIIIGESFSRSHSSLYGYDKLTNPHLQQQRDNGNLIVFSDPVAPATHTAESFKFFMTTFSHETSDREWFECLTLPEALAASGYQTVWFSNQAQTGWYDNISAAFAALCDTVQYTTTPEDGEQGAKPDEILFSCVPSYIQSSARQSLAVFVHLMGQHVDFEQRYPTSYNHFTEDQYANRKAHQRKDYATYDNATLYNDYVVDSLFSTLKGKNAVGIYFSDHGVDFYESADDYCSHANDNNPTSHQAGLKTPFVIYTTEGYRGINPIVMQKLEEMAAKPYRLENLPELVFQVIGYQPKSCYY